MKKEKYVSKHCGNVSHSFKGISYSYISLFLVVMVLVGTTVSWFTIKDNANINSNIMNFNSGTGLRVNVVKILQIILKLITLKLMRHQVLMAEIYFFRIIT